jgi:hypothetical protein
MPNLSKYRLLLLALLPSSALAHGGGLTSETWISLAVIAVTMVAMITAIVKSKWNRNGKTLLLATYLVSVVITHVYLWSIIQDLRIVTACLVFIPIIVVAVNYWMFDNYFRAGK